MALRRQHPRKGPCRRVQSGRRTSCTSHGPHQGRSKYQDSCLGQRARASSGHALSAGNDADISLAKELTECLPGDSTLIGDKAYDSSTLRQTPATKGLNTCIRGRSTALHCPILRNGLFGKFFEWPNLVDENAFADLFDLLPPSGRGISPVRSFPPSGYGLYDMAGNVWQWCSDVGPTILSNLQPKGTWHTIRKARRPHLIAPSRAYLI
jgi:hypothetical protein